EPHERFSDVQEFASALERASHRSLPISSQPKGEAAPIDHQQPNTLEVIQKPKPIWKVPALFTSFIGREQDVADICALLKQPEVRLLTLLGPGGIGKTRLSVQVATGLRDSFADGICFVHLAAVYDPKLVVSAIAEELEIREVGAQSLIDQVKVSLRDKRFLLVLDNFEQVVEAAPQVEELLIACPALKILVTSRVVLHVQGEQEFSVSPLALPNLKQLPEGESLSQFAAVALFIQRARAVLPSFQLNAANARTIAEICVRLDGLPLAIELAAARIKLLPPQALLSRLSQRLQVLTSSTRSLPERQQTLRNTLKWSYDLLDAQEQQFFRRLSVFVGGWTLEAAEVVVGRTIEHAAFSLLDGIASLLDKSLLIQVEHEEWEPYLIMLETIREYGTECLVESGEAAAFQRAHALYYLAWVEQAEPHLKDAQQLTWLARLEREQENLRAALQWLIEQQETELALRFCGALWRFWLIRGYWSEGRRWLESALKLPQAEQPTTARAKALCSAGRFAIRLGDIAAGRSLLESGVTLYRQLEDKQGLTESLIMWDKNSLHAPTALRPHLEESVVLAREVGDQWTLASSLQDLGWFFLGHDEPVAARPLLQESATIFRELGDTHSLISVLTALSRVAVYQENLIQAAEFAQESLVLARTLDNRPDVAEALNYIANTKSIQGDFAQAIVYWQELLVLARELGDKHNIAAALSCLGETALSQSNYAQAEALSYESLQIVRELDDKSHIAILLSLLGDIKRSIGEITQAVAYYTEGLLLAQEVGIKMNIGFNIVGLARIAVAEGQLERATLLFGAAESLNPYALINPDMRADYEQAMENVRTQLGEQAFLTAWKQGQTMKLEQIIAIALQEQASNPTSASPVSQSPKDMKLPAKPLYPDDLTAREVEVLSLVAQGLSDSQIAERLVISPRTVNAHVTSIYRKIQVSSRSAATRYAIEHHLV
ncbi:MAG TPA: tetratricopeptide repeat protein, partial [Ktedonobacteraceae bacterium]